MCYMDADATAGFSEYAATRSRWPIDKTLNRGSVLSIRLRFWYRLENFGTGVWWRALRITFGDGEDATNGI